MTTVLQILAALPSLIKTIIEIMGIAEEALGAGKGSEKKQTVLDAIQALVGDVELWEKTRGLFGGVINMAALFRFGGSGKEPIK